MVARDGFADSAAQKDQRGRESFLAIGVYGAGEGAVRRPASRAASNDEFEGSHLSWLRLAADSGVCRPRTQRMGLSPILHSTPRTISCDVFSGECRFYYLYPNPPIYVIFAFAMSTSANIVRKTFAVCLTLLMSCQTALAGGCVCQACPDSCSNYTSREGFLRTSPVRPLRVASSAATRTATSLLSSSECSDAPAKPCQCNCHQSPRGISSRSSVLGSGKTNLVQFTPYPLCSSLVTRGTVGRCASRVPYAHSARSPLDTCVLLCRFLA